MNDWARRDNVDATYFNAPNDGFIKQKSGFIVPVIYNVKYNVVEEEFIVHFKLDVARTTKCIFLTDSMGMIKEYSSMARNLIKFEPDGTIDSGCLYLEQVGISNYEGDEYK